MSDHRHDELSLLEAWTQSTREMCDVMSELRQALLRNEEPPERVSFRLTQTTPRDMESRSETALSLGVYNPGPVDVYVSVSGEIPRSNSGALKVPAGSGITWPTRVRDLQVGIDPADVASIPSDGQQIECLRYWSVQPFTFNGATTLTA